VGSAEPDAGVNISHIAAGGTGTTACFLYRPTLRNANCIGSARSNPGAEQAHGQAGMDRGLEAHGDRLTCAGGKRRVCCGMQPLVGRVVAMHPVMILAAGLGSRLLPLTLELPKALVPVGDGPLLARLTARLHAAGYQSALLNTHHRATDFRSVFKDLPIHIEESFEPDILGTAGGIANVRHKLQRPLLVHNADIDCDLDFAALTAKVAAGGLCLAVAPREPGQGVVGVDEQGRVVRLRGEQFGNEQQGCDYIGVAALGADCLAQLPDRGCLIGDYCLPRLRSGGPIDTLRGPVQWNDIGSLVAYVDSNFSWLRQWQASSARGGSAYIGAAVAIGSGVEVKGSIVGAAAKLSGSGLIERCIVWPGAPAKAPLKDAIVTSAGRVVTWAAQ